MSLPSIILDTDKTTPIYELPLKIRQGDTGDELQVTLGKSFQKYTDLSTVDVELIAKTPDQRLIKQPVTDKSGNTFKIKFPDEMYTNVGVFRNMYFKVGDDSTSSIKLVVLQGIGSIKEAGSYIDDFETLIKEAESYVSALKDFADTGNAKIDNKVAELTGKMQSFVDQAQKDLNAAKSAWNTFQNNSETAFTTAQDKRASDFNSQKAGFETDFNEQKTDFENRFKALLTNLQGDYDDFKALINKDVADFNASLDSLDAQATDVKNKYDALKAQLDSAAQNISGVRTNLLTNSNFSSGLDHWHINPGDNSDCKAVATTDSDGDTCIHITGTGNVSGIYCTPVSFNQNQVTTGSVLAKGTGKLVFIGLENRANSNFRTISTESYSKVSSTMQASSNTNNFGIYLNPVNGVVDVYIKFAKLEIGSNATDYSLNPLDVATDGSVQTAITSALDKANYSTTAEVDSKISTGVGQAKTYAEQSIKDIIGAAPATLDTIGELADAVTKNKDGVQAINEGITKKADKTDVTALQNTVQTMITSISQADYDKLVSAGTVNPKILYVIPDA
jgi:hypothetical protein